MADEARLIFELVDRSGNSSAPAGQSAPQGPQPSPPGGSPVDDANQRNRPQSPNPTAPQPVQPVSPESPRPVSPTVQPSAQPDSRWGDLVATLSDIAKSIGLTATLQQTAAGQILSFGARAFTATEQAINALQAASEQPIRPEASAPSMPEPTRPAEPVSQNELPPVPDGHKRFYHGASTDKAVDYAAWLSPNRSYAEGYANKSGDGGAVHYIDIPTDHPELAGSYDDVNGYYTNFQASEELSRRLKQIQSSIPAAQSAAAGVPASPSAVPTAGALAVPAAGAGMPAPTLAASAAPVAAVAVPVAVAAAGVYGAYKVGEATNRAAAEIAAGPAGSLSPDIARANAEQSVRELAANLLTAARIGDLVGENVGAQGRLRAELQELRDTVLATSLPATNKLTNAISGMIAALNDSAEFLGGESTAKFAGELFANYVDSRFGGLIGLLERYAEKADSEMRRKQMMESPIGAFESLPFPDLPPPFSGSEEMPLDARFGNIPGLEL